MKRHLFLTFAAAAWSAAIVPAQQVPQDPEHDPVLEAIREFNRRDRSLPNEVTVVLPPSDAHTGIAGPVFVTGKPPADAELINEAGQQEPPAAEPADPPAGPAVRVETTRAGDGSAPSAEVTVRAPFPAKPLAAAPAGWKLVAPPDAPPYEREVELSGGPKVTLSVKPHVLVPDVDGARTFSVAEPGFAPQLGYRQTDTVGAILSSSIQTLDEDAARLGRAIERLQQLLVTLPSSDETPAE